MSDAAAAVGMGADVVELDLVSPGECAGWRHAAPWTGPRVYVDGNLVESGPSADVQHWSL